MRIVPIAFDSMGTRSMATYVETKDLRLFIDPGVSLAPVRFGLPPHPLEVERMNKHWEDIVRHVGRATHVLISHYHYDHHDPEYPEIFEGKEVYVKHPTTNINRSQKERAAYFLPKIEKICRLKYAEGAKIKAGDTEVIFSEAVPHGPSTRLGYVVETIVREGDEVFVHTSDVEGPALKEQVDFILKAKPSVVFLDGPLTYIMYRYGKKNLEKSLTNMKRIVDSGVRKLVVDHHLLRDPKYEERIKEVKAHARETGAMVETAADFKGEKVEPLELMRKELYERFPV